MASAATKILFTCPNCAKVLRSSARPPKGKKIKCPACEEAFLPELEDEDAGATAIQSRPSAKTKAKAPPRDEEDDEDVKPRSKKKRADEDEESDGPPQRKRSRDDDEDEDDDRPIAKKKKAKKKSGSMMLMVVGVVFLGGGALLSCGLCGVGAFVWPGFMRSGPDLEAFLPPDADLVMGGNPKLLKAKFANIEKLIGDQRAGRQRNQQFTDITFNSEKMLGFAHAKDFEKNGVTIFVSNSSDIASVKRNPNLGPAQTLGGHADVHKVTDEGRRDGMGNYVAFPGGNIVIISSQNEPELIAMLTRGKGKPQANAALDLGRAVNKSAFWLAMSPDAEAKRGLRQGFEMAGNGLPGLAMPTLRDASRAVDGIKGFTLAFDFDDKQDIQLNATAICKDGTDANLFKKGVEDAWSVVQGGILLAGAVKQPGMPEIPPTIKEDMATMKFSIEGSKAVARMKLSARTLEDLAKLGAQQRNNFGPGAGPFFPGPGPMPGPGPRPKKGR
jgi:hypothetical protein